MNDAELQAAWLEEERAAHIHGWDFSHIEGRYTESDPDGWDYREEILSVLRPDMDLLDVDTGGGEFLLSLNHPHARTTATEGYPPNAALCRETFAPLGVRFAEVDGSDTLPFDDASFDIVINRHGSYNPADVFRLLRPGGWFITQQVGAQNDRELAQLLLPGVPMPFPGHDANGAAAQFREAGFEILRADDWFGAIRFTDVGALVWFARVIPWEFPGFSVERCLPQLRNAQRIVQEQGAVEGRTHRFLLIARRP